MRRLICRLFGHRFGLWYACSFDPDDPDLLWGHTRCYRCQHQWHGPAADRFREERQCQR